MAQKMRITPMMQNLVRSLAGVREGRSSWLGYCLRNNDVSNEALKAQANTLVKYTPLFLYGKLRRFTLTSESASSSFLILFSRREHHS